MLPRYARCVLSRLRCNGHSLLLGSYLSRIENSSCSACGHLSSHSALSSYGLFEAHFLATLYLFTTSGLDRGELLGFWGSMVFRHAPISGKGSGKQQPNPNGVGDRITTLGRLLIGAEFLSF